MHPLSRKAAKRLSEEATDFRKNIKSVAKKYWVTFDDDDISDGHILIRATRDTPYEGGFFHFTIKIPRYYPDQEPKVILQNTNDGKVSFSPLIQKNGEVELLEWDLSGEPFTNHSIKCICENLIMIFSDLNPIQNADGYEHTVPVAPEAIFYNRYLSYCTWKYAIFSCLNEEFKKVFPKKENECRTVIFHEIKDFQYILEYHFSRKKFINYLMQVCDEWRSKSNYMSSKFLEKGVDVHYCKQDLMSEDYDYLWVKMVLERLMRNWEKENGGVSVKRNNLGNENEVVEIVDSDSE